MLTNVIKSLLSHYGKIKFFLKFLKLIVVIFLIFAHFCPKAAKKRDQIFGLLHDIF